MSAKDSPPVAHTAGEDVRKHGPGCYAGCVVDQPASAPDLARENADLKEKYETTGRMWAGAEKEAKRLQQQLIERTQHAVELSNALLAKEGENADLARRVEELERLLEAILADVEPEDYKLKSVAEARRVLAKGCPAPPTNTVGGGK